MPSVGGGGINTCGEVGGVENGVAAGDSGRAKDRDLRKTCNSYYLLDTAAAVDIGGGEGEGVGADGGVNN